MQKKINNTDFNTRGIFVSLNFNVQKSLLLPTSLRAVVQ